MELSSILKCVYDDVTSGGIGCNDVGIATGYAHIDVIENSDKGIHVSIYDNFDNVKMEAEVFSPISALMILDNHHNPNIAKEQANELIYGVYRSDIERLAFEYGIPKQYYEEAIDHVLQFLNDTMKDEISAHINFNLEEIVGVEEE